MPGLALLALQLDMATSVFYQVKRVNGFEMVVPCMNRLLAHVFFVLDIKWRIQHGGFIHGLFSMGYSASLD